MADNALPDQVAPDSPEIDRSVEAEMTRLLYRSAGFGLFSNLALALILVAGTFSVHPLGLHLPWLTAIILVSGGRWGLNLAFARAQPPPDKLPAWRAAFLLGVWVAGSIWGCAGWLYFDVDQLLPRMLLVFILAGMNAGAARSLASVPIAYQVYVIATLGPLLGRFVTLPESGAWTLAAITVTYGLFLFNTAKLHRADLRQLWRLIFIHQTMVQTLNEAKELAEASSRAKSDFLATMSHEIRTPMNGIMGMLQVLEQSPLNPEQKSQVEIAASSADTLMRLLNDILDFSKIESGRLDFESIPFPLAPAITDVVALLRARAAQKRLGLSLDLSPDLPAYVVGDAVRLKQVLLNLTGNAIKFTERGGVEISVRVVRCDNAVATLRFAVNDTGIGMTESTQTKLFQVFSQGDSSMNRRFGGTGLGLAISQRLVNRMGGHIAVESAPDRGSRFSFELTVPLGSSPSQPSRASFAVPARSLAGRVLVVEDDRVNQRVIELLLEKLGLQAVVVADGESAVAVAALENWDAVLMDCQMPGMDGLEATRQIRARLQGRPLPIIALTANAMNTDRDVCVLAGMDDFLAKPVRQEELHACLERWITMKGAAADEKR